MAPTKAKTLARSVKVAKSKIRKPELWKLRL